MIMLVTAFHDILQPCGQIEKRASEEKIVPTDGATDDSHRQQLKTGHARLSLAIHAGAEGYTSREIKLSMRFLMTLGSGLNSFMSC